MSERTPGTTASARLHQLLADEWEFRMRENPVFATRCGDHRFDDKLPAVSEEDVLRRAGEHRVFLRRLREIPRDGLPAADRLNYDIFQRQLADRIAETELRTHWIGLSRMGGVHKSFTYLPDVTPFHAAEDYERYVARLNAFPAHLRGHLELMRAGIREGFTQPRVIVQGADHLIRSQIVSDAEDSVFFQPLRNMPKRIDEARQRRLRQAARSAIHDAIVPAYRHLLAFVEKEYLPAARKEIAAAALPNGRALYEHRVRMFTTLDVTPREVHDTGLAEVQRIRGEMADLIARLGFQGTFRQFVDSLRCDPRFYVDTPEKLLKEAALIAKRMDGELPRLFKTLPRTPYGLRPIPDHVAPDATSAYYSPPSGDFTRAGLYWLNTCELGSRPLYELEALTLHEAVPGHHLQFALQMELPDVPNFRRHGSVTAFSEGWALYAEGLGKEVGFYQDPHSDFGRLTFRMWRACRLVVDTGLHCLGWTRDQAIDHMTENTALSLRNITNEVDRYIAWPGQAVSYMMGELAIRKLRVLAEEKLAGRFDLREFHEALHADGAVPLSVLKTRMRQWVARQRPPAVP